MRRLELTGGEGRKLEVELGGPDEGEVLLFLNGTPQAGALFGLHVDAGAERGLRHVAYSRPGYAISDRDPGRAVADCVRDVTTIVDQLGIERFYVVGWSGGGPHALACAALLGDRVNAAATMASVAPRNAAGLDWFADMGAENIEEFGAADAGEEQLLAWLEENGEGFARSSASELCVVLGDLLSEVDKDVLTGEFAEYLSDSIRRGLAHGLWGWFDDDVAFVKDWGFDLGAISRPVAIWQGGQDKFVPYAHGEWLAEHVAGARAELHPDHGHLSIALGSYGQILDQLLEA